MAIRVLGVDACKTGWIGIVLEATSINAVVAPTIGALLTAAGPPVDAVAIDIPIGLPDTSRRRADEEARRRLGPRASSVFYTPVRAALTRPDYRAANAENRRLAGEGTSAQAYRLGPKILDVDAWVRTTTHTAIEVHPELSFATMAGAPLEHPKKTWSGTVRRWRLLHDHGIPVPLDLGPAGAGAAVDDVLDAAAAAWTARRFVLGEATRTPDRPEVFSDGLPAAIWS